MTANPATMFEVAHGIATLTLNDGGRMNPLTHQLQRGCLEALQRVRDDTAIRALVITATGKGFCVGADLAEFGRRAAEPGASIGSYVGEMMEKSGNPIMAAIRSLPVPVVCAVNGAAAGGGVGFALAADMVIAARSAYFYLPFVPALGLVPDMGASWVLPRAVGRARALGLALTGNKLSAETAVQWGLIWACVDDADLQEQALQLAAQLAALPAGAITEARQLFAAAESNTFEDQLALERSRQMELIDRPNFAEGVAAFTARRKPAFKGRG
ncbi:enoyl-CoA hydratase [Variovorax sp. WS11]|uniref:enoyl-CoA hydratase-related protein n=1 Tax=Variovorax sp. WS11 TaxID=1105204 RepID=UPI000D0DA820|nr:enoyl-CoA hydratase-related protein [Variovorax sp. WS11]NDZ18905.1 enoyl-CoA hydratase [Variovorax sp. WS11]PSL80071.1 enoyl-CoA hydratase [Variovorax sp. WS11]